MPDFNAIADAIGGVSDILSGITGFVGSIGGTGFEQALGSLEVLNGAE